LRVAADFFCGVIEGFYGAPWSASERAELFEWMARWRLNTYMYAPKDDLKHRAVWRESYTSEEADRFRELIGAAAARGIRFVYALSPGLDIRYDDPAELHVLQRRVDQMMTLGCRDFALLFDDIPDTLDEAVIARFGSLAAAQCDVTNALTRWIVEKEPAARIAFCPTPYCSRMVKAGLGGEGYLQTIGRELMPSIDVFWTGPDIVSREITAEHVREIASILRRRPIIWDNLFANDYDGHRFFCGPYAGRPGALLTETNGLLLNPNNELLLNYVPLQTFSAFVHGAEGAYDPRKAYLAAIREWAAWFETINGPIPLDDVILLGDCYYLPYEDGPEADALYEQARQLIARMAADEMAADGMADGSRPDEWRAAAARFRERAGHLRQLCVRLAELRRRPLFHALSRRVWDLKEELDLLDRFVGASGHPMFTSDYHRPGTYRGGLVAKLQRLLAPKPDGTFAAPSSASSPQSASNPQSVPNPQ
jgi:protein O-GlcNAcase / histone acetyltransferase